MSDDTRIDDLLLQWDDLRRSGEEVTADELAADCPELIEPLRQRISAIQAMDWLDSEAGGDDRTHLTSLVADQASVELPDASLSSDDLLKQLSDGELMSTRELERWMDQHPDPKLRADARALAARLIEEGKITHYQASILLQGETEKLLVDKYLILDSLDAGGMGVVFKAIHRPMNRIVALKMLSPHLLNSPDKVQRFRREVQVAASLTHQNIVVSHDADESKGVHFLVMEYVEGRDLRKIVDTGGPLTVEQAVDCLLQAARGLAHAHRKGIIHRDVKPSNLMLSTDGVVKVLDLGLARMNEELQSVEQDVSLHQTTTAIDDQPGETRDHLTHAGTLMGTVAFMAPEQAVDTHNVDHRADIYSLGCTLYYLLIGEPPYRGETPMQTVIGHRESPIPSLRRFRPDVPEGLEAICRKMMAKKRGDRQQSMAEVITEIEGRGLGLPDQNRRGENRYSAPNIETDASQSDYVRNLKGGGRAKKHSWRLRTTVVVGLVLASVSGSLLWRSGVDQDEGPQQATESGVGTANHNSESRGVELASPRPATAGSANFALQFDGIDDYVELPSIPPGSTPSLTIEARLRVRSSSDTGIVYQGPNNSHKLYHNSAESQLKPQFWVFGYEFGNGCLNAISHDKVNEGRERHIAAVWEDNEPRLYIDGLLVSSADSGYWTRIPGFVHAYIGGRPQLGIWRSSSIDGTIDEFRISTSVRYTADFTPADRFEPDADTLALYHFDEGQGDVLIDSSGNGHHGKIIGAQWVRLDEERQLADVNRALRFEPGMIELATFDWNDSEEMTWEATVSLNEDRWCSVFRSLGEGLNHWYLWRLRDGSWEIAVKDGPENVVLATAKAPRQVSVDQNFQLAMVVDETSLRLFVDGEQVASADRPTTATAPLVPIRLGNSNRNNDTFFGTIDEVRFSNIARYMEDYTPTDRFEPDEHTIALYHCDDAGDTLVDSSGNGYHVNLKEAATGNVARVRVYDEANMSAADLLATGEYEWQVIEKLPEPINSRSGELGADITADGLTIVFASQRRDGSYGAFDLWMSTRPSIGAPWSVPVNLGPRINTAGAEMSPALSPDGLTLIYESIDDQSEVGRLISTRDSVTSPWSAPEPFTPASNSAPDPIAANTALALVRSHTSEMGVRSRDIWITMRSTASDPWPNPVRIDGPVNSDEAEDSPVLSEDGRLLIFARVQKEETESIEWSGDLWMATRDDWNSPWSDPVPLDSINSSALDRTPRLLPDGKTLLFDSWREGRSGDIYLARLVRKQRPTSTRPNFALQFEDPTDHVHIRSLQYDGGPLTMEAIVELDATQTQDWSVIMVSAGTQDASLTLSKWIGFAVQRDAADRRAATYDSEYLPVERPVHLAAVYDGERTALYIDGKRAGYDRQKPAEDTFSGRYTQLGSPEVSFAGRLREVRISDVARYDLSFVPTDDRFEVDGHTLALYRMEEGQGDVLVDSSGNAHDGEIRGPSWVPVDDTRDSEPVDPFQWADYLSDDAPPPAVAPFEANQAVEHQRAWAEYLNLPVEREISLPDGESLTMVLVPPGEFLMGSSEEQLLPLLHAVEDVNESFESSQIISEGPQHRVCITRPFYLSRYEVTQAQWVAVMGENPSEFADRPSHPVERVAWDETEAFLTQLTATDAGDRLSFRLPTEAEWEFACRAGTTSTWWFGDDEAAIDQHAWHRGNSGRETHPVGQWPANPWGLHDLHGNVWELCVDAFGYFPDSLAVDPVGSGDDEIRVMRGGAWLHIPRYCRSAKRQIYKVGNDPLSNIGLRLAAAVEIASDDAVRQPDE